MNLKKRKKFAEMIFFLGWKRHKDDVYTPQSILDLVYQNMDFIQSRPYLESEYLRIFGLDNPFTRSRDVFILIFWIKLKDEFDLIYRRLFNNNKEDFVNFYYPIIHKLYRHHHLDDRTALNVDLWTNPIGNEGDIIDDFPRYSLPDYWNEQLEFPFLNSLNQLYSFYHQFSIYYLKFFKFLFNEIDKKTIDYVFCCSYLTQYIHNSFENLGFSYRRKFTNGNLIMDVYIHLFHKKEIRFLYQLWRNSIMADVHVLQEWGIEGLLGDGELIIPMNVNYWFKRPVGLLVEDLDFEGGYGIQFLNKVILGPHIEIVTKKEFFRRFWEMPDL